MIAAVARESNGPRHCRVAGDVALAGGAGEAVLAEAAGGFAAAIEPRDDLAVHVDHLALAVDAKSGARVMHHRRRPGGVEWRVGGLFPPARLSGIPADAGIAERILEGDAFPPH